MPERLDSWKAIANYLGRDIRTAVRWEAERGLPVRRVPGTKRSGVFAYREELDAWLAAHPTGNGDPPAERTPEPAAIPRRVWIYATTAVAVGIVLAAGFISWADDPAVVRLDIRGTELRALDDESGVLWTHGFDAAVLEPGNGRWTHIGDLDGVDGNEIVAVVKVGRKPGGEIVDQLLAFSNDGRLEWTRIPDAQLRFGDGAYGPPWTSEDLLAFESDGQPRLAWAIRHYTWWPSMVLVFDAGGAERGRFVNSGWIRRLAISQDGSVLFASGISNAHRATFVARLDAAHVAGSSPEDTDSSFACLECGADRPLGYVVAPRTDVSEQAIFPPLYAPEIQTFSDGHFQLRVSENSDPSPPEMIYEFSAAHAVTRARFSERFWDSHRRLHADGTLQHDERDCPLRAGLDVREWTPSTGWHILRVPAN